jgi:cytochrome c biogenesis protein CcdA/thiol-disulfide isomerase/thioredoxin
VGKALIFVLALFVLGFPGWVLEIEAQEPVVRILLFYSQTCPHCEVVINDFLPGIQEKYGDQIEIKLLDISDSYNYGLLISLEDAAKMPQEKRGIPMMFVGHTIMVGSLSIKDNLEEVIDGYLAEGGVDYLVPEELLVTPTPKPAATPQPTPTAQAENRPIHIAYFYEIGCQECDGVTYDLNYLQSKYPNLVVETFDVQNDAALSEWLGERYGVPEEKRLTTPRVFVGQDYLLTTEINVKSLEALIGKYRQTGTEAIWEGFGGEEASEARASLIERLGSPALLTVLGTGLANGLNPCALATIVFFISYLAFSGRKGREVLFVGVAFTLGVFLTYLLAGFGLLQLLEPLDAMRSGLRNWISGIGALLCLTLAFISFRDYFTAQEGRPEDVSLRLPRPLQRRVHHIIRESSNVRAFVLVAFAIGLVISVILLTCTSPLYVGVMFLIQDVPELRASSYLYILLYNLAFIAPLIVIFLLAYFGTTSEQLARVIGRQTGAIKLLTASLFLVLAGWLIYGLI